MISKKMSKKITEPLDHLEKHLAKLTQGQWMIPKIEPQNEDEFSELIFTYNYFYKSLQNQSLLELKQLEALKNSSDPILKEKTIDRLIYIKKNQLNKNHEKRSYQIQNIA